MKFKIFIILMFLIFNNNCQEFRGIISIPKKYSEIIDTTKSKNKYFVPKHIINYKIPDDILKNLIIPVRITFNNISYYSYYLPLNIFRNSDDKFKGPIEKIKLIKSDDKIWNLILDHSFDDLDLKYNEFLMLNDSCSIQ